MNPLRDDQHRRIFADTRRVAKLDGAISHRWHAARKEPQPVVVNDRPWEAAGIFVYGTVLPEHDRFRLWYQARDKLGGNGHVVGYAESGDGLHWEKPDLGLVDFDGSRANNLTNLRLHLPSVGRAPEGGYWATGHVWARASNQQIATDQQEPGVYRFDSADGFDWTARPNGLLWSTSPVPDAPYGGGSDVQTLIHDPWRNRYIAATKFHVPYESKHRRAFATRTSDNLIDWSDPVMALAPDAADDERARALGFEHADFYGVTFHPYPDFILGFVWVFYMEGTRPDTDWPQRQSNFGWQRHGHMAEVQTVFSYDGQFWMRPPTRQPLISTGERGDWDGGNVATANQPVLIGDELFHYYGGGPVHHGATTRTPDADRPPTGVFTSIGVARMKRDRYASYSSSSGGSLVVTHGELGGTRLTINARAPYGSVRCAVLDAAGQEFPGLGLADCVPFLGDETDGVISWKETGLDSIPAGTPVALRFVLEEADLFGYSVEG